MRGNLVTEMATRPHAEPGDLRPAMPGLVAMALTSDEELASVAWAHAYALIRMFASAPDGSPGIP